MCGTGVALSKSMREAASNSDIWLMLNVKVDLGLDKIKLQFVRVIISQILAHYILENRHQEKLNLWMAFGNSERHLH